VNEHAIGDLDKAQRRRVGAAGLSPERRCDSNKT
jgi:hypothetical protein